MTSLERIKEDFGPSHAAVVRMALVYSFLAIASGAFVGLALYKIAFGESGFVVMLVIFGLVFLLCGYWARHYIRDLSATPVVIEGEVMRKWSKGNVLIFFLPSYYILVQGKIFSINRIDYAMLLENDLVRVHCYPHSLCVHRVERFDELDKEFIPASSGASTG